MFLYHIKETEIVCTSPLFIYICNPSKPPASTILTVRRAAKPIGNTANKEGLSAWKSSPSHQIFFPIHPNIIHCIQNYCNPLRYRLQTSISLLGGRCAVGVTPLACIPLLEIRQSDRELCQNLRTILGLAYCIKMDQRR